MEDKVVLITGGYSGLGSGIAKHLTTLGYKKFSLVDIKEAKDTAEECRKLGATDVLVLTKDITKSDEREAAVNDTVKHFGGLDVLINNAGKCIFETIRDSPMEYFDELCDLLLKAPVHMSKLALPHLEKTKGNIVFIGSMSSHMCLRKIPFYSTMKAGVTHFAKCLALEEAENGIRVNIVSPGNIRTPFYKSHKTMPWKTIDEVESLFGELHAMKRIGEVEEISSVVGFVISRENSFMTGSDILVDGGAKICQGH